MAKFLFQAVFVFFSLTTFGQKDFYEGYIIALNDDTVYGKIKDKRPAVSMNQKPIKISFIGSNNIQITFLASQLKGYSKGDIKNYVSIRDLNEGPFFSRVLVKGPLSLLTTQVEGVAFYKNQPAMLPQRVNDSREFLVHKNKKRTIEISMLEFKKQMAEFFADYYELQQSILNKELRYSDLEIIVSRYNDWYLKNRE